MFKAHPVKLNEQQCAVISGMVQQRAELQASADALRERINGLMILFAQERGLNRDRCVLADDCCTILYGENEE